MFAFLESCTPTTKPHPQLPAPLGCAGRIARIAPTFATPTCETVEVPRGVLPFVVELPTKPGFCETCVNKTRGLFYNCFAYVVRNFCSFFKWNKLSTRVFFWAVHLFKADPSAGNKHQRLGNETGGHDLFTIQIEISWNKKLKQVDI